MIQVNNIDTKDQDTIRFVCISDTHGKTSFEIPDGDVLIHAGDMSRKNTILEYEETFRWLSSLPHKLKIITAGNHDHFFDRMFPFDTQRVQLLGMMLEYDLVYLEHTYYELPPELGSFKLFVSPYSPIHFGGAFMLDDMSDIWDTIPNDIDILVTHTPPYGLNDKTVRGRHVGCKYLKEKIDQVQPKVSVCGHIHEAQGYTFHEGILYINACLSDHRYRAVNKPITFDLIIK